MRTVFKKLGELAEIRQGYSTRRAVNSLSHGTHYLLQIRDFNEDRTAIRTAALMRFSPESAMQANALRAGDLVFLAKGSRNFSLAPRDLPAPTLAANYFFVIRPKGEVLPDYLAWHLNQPGTKEHLTRFSGGGVHMPVVRKDVLAALEVPVPPKAAQEAIVALAGLADQEQMLLKQLARARKALCDAACMRAAGMLREKETDHE